MDQGQQHKTTYELLREKREGAISVLYGRYGKKLYSYAASSWNLDEDNAWEIVYETLYKTLEKIDDYQFDSEKKFGSFLFTIFCNNLRRHYRDTRKREERLSFTHFNESLFEASRNSSELGTERKVQDKLAGDALDAYRTDEQPSSPLMEMLESCLEELQDWERILLLLRSQDMPYNEVAAYINKPADQLKVYHQRAKKKLTMLLENKRKEKSPVSIRKANGTDGK